MFGLFSTVYAIGKKIASSFLVGVGETQMTNYQLASEGMRKLDVVVIQLFHGLLR